MKEKQTDATTMKEKLTRTKAKVKVISQIRFVPLNEALNGSITSPWLQSEMN